MSPYFAEKLRLLQPLLHAIDCQIDNAKSKLQGFGTMDTNLVIGCIGDDLLSVP